jgi:hypothetical protein
MNAIGAVPTVGWVRPQARAAIPRCNRAWNRVARAYCGDAGSTSGRPITFIATET